MKEFTQSNPELLRLKINSKRLALAEGYVLRLEGRRAGAESNTHAFKHCGIR